MSRIFQLKLEGKTEETWEELKRKIGAHDDRGVIRYCLASGQFTAKVFNHTGIEVYARDIESGEIESLHPVFQRIVDELKITSL